MPGTYNTFRQGVKAANRLTMATKIANFVKENYLDGVDIDWEYPGVCYMIQCLVYISNMSLSFRHLIFREFLLTMRTLVTIIWPFL